MAVSLQKASFPSIAVDESGEATRIVRSGLFILFIFFCGFIAWGGLAPISGAIIAGGHVKIDTQRKTIQHLDGGIIREILVREGSVVEQGQPLITLEDTTSSSNLNILIDQLDALLAKEARSSAEKSLSKSIDFPPELLRDRSEKLVKIVHNERAVFETRRRSLNDQSSLIHEEIAQARVAESGLKSQIAAIKDSIGFISERLRAAEKLIEKGFIEKTELLKIKESLSQKKEDLGKQTAELAQIRERMAELELQVISLRDTYVEDADNELKETRKEIFEIEERVRPAKDAQERQVIFAPIKGQVIDLKVSTTGGVVKPGEPLMDIVPDNSALLMEVKIQPKDADSVFIDQESDVQLDAYNRRTTPLLRGKVIYVSGDTLEDQTAPTDRFYYLAHIAVDDASVKAIQNISLSPGMPVTAFLKTNSKTFLEYLASPLLDHFRRTFRED
jgi:epimerase transport system membrane fusion protein